MFKYSFLLCLLISLIYSCSPIDDNLLLGEWQAAALLEEGDSLAVDVQEITLSFNDDMYHYTSTLNYRESGNYFVNERYLFTIDTINQASSEKAVEIQLLSADSLHLRMQESGKERLLKLVKAK